MWPRCVGQGIESKPSLVSEQQHACVPQWSSHVCTMREQWIERHHVSELVCGTTSICDGYCVEEVHRVPHVVSMCLNERP